MMMQLGQNIGYETKYVVAHKSQDDFTAKQKEAWDMVREAIDQGIPCYGFELEAPEFYVLNGYDDVGYYYSGPVTKPGNGPIPWQKLGDTNIGILEVKSVRPGKVADDSRTVKEALEFALEHSRGPEKWILPNYRAGLAGYDTWIETLEEGIADGMGMSYNSMVWAECRGFGERFLREANRRLNAEAGALLREAADKYSEVYEHLVKVVELFPFPPGNEINDKKRCEKGV
ncbi:MAG: hypothetical protein JSU58_07160, partial [Dehalococcoidales bacterium]